MDFHVFAHYLEEWNKWIVFPVIAIAALIFHIRQRKTSTKLIFAGALIFAIGDLLTSIHKSYPQDPLYITSMILSAIGWIVGMGGVFLYWRKDYVPKSKIVVDSPSQDKP